MAFTMTLVANVSACYRGEFSKNDQQQQDSISGLGSVVYLKQAKSIRIQRCLDPCGQDEGGIDFGDKASGVGIISGAACGSFRAVQSIHVLNLEGVGFGLADWVVWVLCDESVSLLANECPGFGGEAAKLSLKLGPREWPFVLGTTKAR